MIRGLKKLDGVKDVRMEKDRKQVWVFHVTFSGRAEVKVPEVRKAVQGHGAFNSSELREIGVTLTRKVREEDKKYTAGGLLLANPSGTGDEKPKDLLGEVAALVKAGKDNLQLTGVLSEESDGKQTVTLSAVKSVRSE